MGVLLVFLVAGCTSDSSGGNRGASAVVSAQGAVPIPTAAATDPTPTASPGHVQVLAMGDPVEVILPDGTDAIVTMRGPNQAKSVPTGPGDNSTPATVTLLVDVRKGAWPLAATDLDSRDELGQAVALRPVGASAAEATPGHPVQLVVGGTFNSGSAQVTLRRLGEPVALWDFTIELD